MTREQEFALDVLLYESGKVLELNRRRQQLLAKGLSGDLATTQKQLHKSTIRLHTAWTCYGQGEYREAVMALMDG
jgi:hypothetical protein